MRVFRSGRIMKRAAAQPMPVICAWCRARERFGETWGPLRSDPETPRASHGICPACLAREKAKVDSGQ